MGTTDRLDVTLLGVLEESGANLLEAEQVVDALGLPTMESICTTRLRDLDSDQIRMLAVMLRRSADEILELSDAAHAPHWAN